MIRHGKLIVPLAISAALALTACSDGDRGGSTVGGNDAGGFTDFAGVQAEYKETVVSFPYALPEGVTFPDRLPDPTEEARYQSGIGLMQAYFFWECAWEDRYFRTNGTDQAGADAALDQLEEGRGWAMGTGHLEDPENEWKTKVLAPARLGDGAVLREFYDSGCAWYREENGQ